MTGYQPSQTMRAQRRLSSRCIKLGGAQTKGGEEDDAQMDMP